MDLRCVSSSGKCVVPPVIRPSAGASAAMPKRTTTNEEATRCQACWLKLCLLGYNLESDLYDRLRDQLPEVIREQLPEGGERKSLLSHRGEILECSRQVPLSRPLFGGYEGAENESDVNASAAAIPGSPAKSSTSTLKAINNGLHERLPNGWKKKAVKRVEGGWDVFLITPDQKILRTPGDLKLYVAKAGAIVDANIVNFSLPKRTAKTDKQMQKAKTQKENVRAEGHSPVVVEKRKDEPKPPAEENASDGCGEEKGEDGDNLTSVEEKNGGETSDSAAGTSCSPNGTPLKRRGPPKGRSKAEREMRMLGLDESDRTGRKISLELPKQGQRREAKKSAKLKEYMEEEEKSKKGAQVVTVEGVVVVKRKRGRPRKEEVLAREAVAREAAALASEEEFYGGVNEVEALRDATNSRLETIGVGAFSIDKDSVRGECRRSPHAKRISHYTHISLLFAALPAGSSLSQLRFKTFKRSIPCKTCENCSRQDCMECVYCLDRKKHGGRGNLKKVCM